MTYGATPEQWKRFCDLGLTADLLPVVSDPTVPIDANSTLKATGKTPSVVKANGCAVGLYEWTKRRSTPADIARWSADDRLGISVQCRTIRAFDIDITDQDKAIAIYSLIVDALDGLVLPERYRPGTGKCLLAFRYDGELPKRVAPVDGGMVEVLGDGQQFIAHGWHAGGQQHYLWTDLGDEIPLLDEDQIEAVWVALESVATGKTSIARQKREGVQLEGVYKDELAEWLVANWEVYGEGQDGQLFCRCPFDAGHSTASGDTSTAYFVAGTGGYERGHWVCLHASCAARVDEDFTAETGYRAASFHPLPATVYADPLVQQLAFGKSPGFVRDKNGVIEPLSINLGAALSYPPLTQYRLVFDAFRGEIVWHPVDADGTLPEGESWRQFTDADYTRLRQRLERMGFRGVGKEMLREAVHLEAVDHQIDTAHIWLSRLRWDGVSRIRGFLSNYFGVGPSAYAEAVSRYIWSALAGRVIEPGVQADMVPILIGEQGARKTSAIKAMVPDRSNYVTINMTQRDTDLSRLMRGKLIGELEELRGFNSRDAEEIKAWVTKTEEEWVPKFKEFGTTFPRRLVFMGSGNEDEILADATGERRYLPFWAGTHGAMSPERIAADREQLWAEGAALFRLDGVQWEQAETLAKIEHQRFKVRDGWTGAVLTWLSETDMTGEPRVRGDVSTADVLTGALGIAVAHIDARAERRMRRVLLAIGLRQDAESKLWRKDQTS